MIRDNMRHELYQEVTEKLVLIYDISECTGKYVEQYKRKIEVKSEIVD
jgi:hypothetical protein